MTTKVRTLISLIVAAIVGGLSLLASPEAHDVVLDLYQVLIQS